MAKRPGDEFTTVGAVVPLKKGRNELVQAVDPSKSRAVVEMGPPRTSSLFAPIMQLSGHQGEVYSCKFHPDGRVIASAGYDRQLYLWNVFGECENLAALQAHKGAILDVQYSVDGTNIFTASTDKTIIMWDSKTMTRVKKMKGHSSIVNSCHASRRGPQLLVSAGDDCNIKIWDLRDRKCSQTYKDKYQNLAVTFNENSDQVIFGGIDNLVKVYDMRKGEILYSMVGHFDSITGLSLSPDGSFVLSNAMDNTLCIWDIRPFASKERCTKTLQGHQHNAEKNLLRCSWSPDGTKVSAGSADRHVYIWDTHYRRILYKLPGHHGAVTEVVFHPSEPIVLSGSIDKELYLGEIEP
ncbi:U5 small nuclear ribonucleoprotein 40 kDa protein [Tetranychus urticae]|uniref:U5 small nuclear ribonucleoprotein 40 kDa protein n=1 Tax=Tetranychus urticae TaxID=32264 RepID=T1K8X8_TETUR|nr:U5 small nuclear ribonucleoprotein 40 kDa protein [Tetranychus urticae]